MDMGENKLNAEMMKKLYEAYKLDTKEKIDEFNEAARKIISDKEYPEAEDILKLVEGKVITDNHERRIHDPSIYKYHGRQVLHTFFDEPYPVMMPEDVKTMKGMMKETIAGYPVEWINGIGDPEFDALTGCTQNFKPQQTCDKVEALVDILDTEASDRNGRIWKREFMKKVLNNQIFLTVPRGHKSWLWLKLLEMQLQKSYEMNLVQTLESPPSTKWDIDSVIHMRWPKPNLSDLKPEVGEIDDPILIDYITDTFGPIDQMTMHSFMRHWSELVKESSGPNLNDNKKALERVIKKGRKHK